GELGLLDREAGPGAEAPRLLEELEPGLTRVLRVAEGAAVHEVDVRVVEGVLHEAQPCAAPELVELLDAPEARVVPFRDLRDLEERCRVEANPDVAVALLSGKACYARPFGNVPRDLRDPQHLAGVVVGPAVVAAHQRAAFVVAARQRRGAMAAAILERAQAPFAVAPHHDALAEQSERLRPVLDMRERDDRVPEPAQDLLFSHQHERLQACAPPRAPGRGGAADPDPEWRHFRRPRAPARWRGE